jgi:hypothetical protein
MASVCARSAPATVVEMAEMAEMDESLHVSANLAHTHTVGVPNTSV